MKNKNILVVQNLLQLLPLDSLRDPEIIVNLIRAFGIVQWGPDVFGKDEIWKNRSSDMAGIYQTPAQLAEALVYLSDKKIENFIEIGTFQGGNFLFMAEYLRRFNPDIQCFTIDPTGFLNPEVAAVIDAEDWMKFIPCPSDDLSGKKFDLVFIDAGHTKAEIENDWQNLGRHAQICMVHDIQETTCPGVIEFWENLKKDNPKAFIVEFLDHDAPVPLQGIGIIINPEPKKGK